MWNQDVIQTRQEAPHEEQTGHNREGARVTYSGVLRALLWIVTELVVNCCVAIFSLPPLTTTTFLLVLRR